MDDDDQAQVERATRTDVARRLAGTTGLRGAATIAGVRWSGLQSPAPYSFLTGDPYPNTPLPAGEREAMGLPPFGRGVALLCNAIAGTTWRAMRWDPATGVNVRLADQPAVLTDPDPVATPWNYRWAAVEDLILYGNHFALYGDLDYRTLRPGWLVPVSASDVWVIVDPETHRWSWTMAGEMLDPDELLHVSAGNRSGELLGRGVLAQYGPWLGGTVAAEEHTGAYFAGGALPPAVLQSPTLLNQEQADDLKAKWRDMTNSREPVVLPNGYVLTPIVSNAESAQLVESRQWNAALVAMLLGIPSYKLGLAGPSMTYQNIESADIEFVRDSVDRYGSPLVEAFTKWLMPRGTVVAWDYAGRMRADQSTTMAVLTGYVTAGILTLDEARAMLNRPPLDPDDGPALEAPPDDQADQPDDQEPDDQADEAGPILTPEEVTPNV
jgi:HK97 family phage portal protein